jgi:hypothetical protein
MANKPKPKARVSPVERCKVAIKAVWQKQISNIIATGKELIAAKKDLGHKNFGTMFEGEDPLPFGIDVAEALMKIARHSTLANPEHAPILPTSWTTLEVLARVTPAQLKEWLDDETVNATTTRHTAECLVARLAALSRPKTIQDPDRPVFKNGAYEIPGRIERHRARSTRNASTDDVGRR